MDYNQLQKIAKEIVLKANDLNILSRLYWYTPKSRKVESISKIGYYETKPSKIRFEHGCKLIIVFPRDAFASLEIVINSHLLSSEQVAYRDDYRSGDDTGFDVYQRVSKLKLFIEPDQVSSKGFTAEAMLKKERYWADCQRKVMQDMSLTEQQIINEMNVISGNFKKALSYLQSQCNTQARLQVRRNCGVRHKMIRVDLADEKTKKVSFSDLVLVFGSSSLELPQVIVPKEPSSNRKPRSDSISAQFKRSPSNFKYYDKFGIFEVYDK